MPVAVAEKFSNVGAAFAGQRKATASFEAPVVQTAVPEDPHASLLRRRFTHLDITAPLPKHIIVDARVVQESDSRVTVATPPSDARDPYVLETPTGKIPLHTAPSNLLAVLARQGNKEADEILYGRRLKHEGRHHAGDKPSTVETVLFQTQQRAERAERIEAGAQQVGRLSGLMTRLGFNRDGRRGIWGKLIKDPSLLNGQVQTLEAQAVRSRK